MGVPTCSSCYVTNKGLTINPGGHGSPGRAPGEQQSSPPGSMSAAGIFSVLLLAAAAAAQTGRCPGRHGAATASCSWLAAGVWAASGPGQTRARLTSDLCAGPSQGERALPQWLTGLVAVTGFLFLTFIAFLVNRAWCGTSRCVAPHHSPKLGWVPFSAQPVGGPAAGGASGGPRGAAEVPLSTAAKPGGPPTASCRAGV